MAEPLDFSSIVMAWSEFDIQIREKGGGKDDWFSLGAIKLKSSTLTAEDGDTLEAAAVGGVLIGYERLAGSFVLTTTVMEPQELYNKLGISTSRGVLDNTIINVNSHVVKKEFELKLVPGKAAAWGLYAPKCSVSIQPSWSEETGNEVVITFGILQDVTLDYWYKKVKFKQAS